MSALDRKITLNDLRAVRSGAPPMPFLTCYDFTSARLLQQAGVPGLLVGDSAAGILLGHSSTVPVRLGFMIEITAAVRRGAPLALLMADMPFGSYHGSLDRGVQAVCRMVKLSGCDCVKLEVGASHLRLVRELAEAGVAVFAHLGLRPQSVGLAGGYRVQAKTAEEAMEVVNLAQRFEDAGAAGLLIEAVPAEVARAVVDATAVPVIGCGAGDRCHGSVVVTHDAMSLTEQRPRFVPVLDDLAAPMVRAAERYVRDVAAGSYPAPEHRYSMPQIEKDKFLPWAASLGRGTS